MRKKHKAIPLFFIKDPIGALGYPSGLFFGKKHEKGNMLCYVETSWCFCLKKGIFHTFYDGYFRKMHRKEEFDIDLSIFV